MTGQAAGKGGDPVPAIREDEATGIVAELFEDLRRTMGVPMVNLVWRHLAAMPGALDWTWGTLKPLYASGAIAAAMAALHGRMTLPPLPAMPAAALRAVGLASADIAAVARMLDSYDRGNSMNLLAFSTLLGRLDGMPPTAGALPETAPPPVEGRLPRLLVAAEMTPAAAELVVRLNALGQPEVGPIIASLYRHLAHWPGYLAMAWALLAPIDSSGALRPAIARTRSEAMSLGAVLAGRLADPPPAPSPEVAAYVRNGLSTFRDHGIARMVTIGRILRAAHPEP
ncbi:MAG: hypothetical protein AB7P02_18215 [Alphaproteobacteria bacterium]